ncbi:MAG: VWA domain-containing protein [bacterium]|nr:VWA domain-containing protein [bacterium]
MIARQLPGIGIALLLAGACLISEAALSASVAPQGEPIDLVISLDTSGTMRGLIDSTRIKIWEIINDLAEAEPTPNLRVAILTYGNQTGSPADGWGRIETGLTADLDLVSERLFALESRGANEYVGRAIQTALERLEWSESENALKLLFVAGNESADQELDVDFREMSEAARERNILLSAIFCGQPDHADAASWREMAQLADGQFTAIDHTTPTVVVPTRFDNSLSELGALMNKTYIPVGKEGKAWRRSLAKEDENASSLGAAVAATRAMTKASPLYSPDWDLVNSVDQGRVDLASIAVRELPREMSGMTTEERFLYVDEMREARLELRQRIAELGIERRRAVANRTAAFGARNPRSFDEVVRGTIREQARENGFDFPEE